MLRYGFGSLKVDGCGNETDLRVWNKYLTHYTKVNNDSYPILVENCHGADPRFKPNRTLPPSEGCPYHFYRTSIDIRNHYPSIMHNLGSVEPYHKSNSSYPGCWAYPDMLQVGVPNGLSPAETRSHFGGWAIISSPLILSMDVNDGKIIDDVWDIITNREILQVNQAYFGDSGGTYFTSNKTIILRKGKYMTEVPLYQYLSKRINENAVAILLMNSGNTSRILETKFKDIPGFFDISADGYHGDGDDGNNDDDECFVRDLWNHIDIGFEKESLKAKVDSHDAAFFLLTKSKEKIPSINRETTVL